MIIYIIGKVLRVNKGDKNTTVDILCSSGVGYRVFIPARLENPSVNSEISLYTSFIVREDSQTLFGFADIQERDLFELLITVSGIGPKTGMGILSKFSADEIKELIANGDHKSLCKVSGLGDKGAKKIIIELQTKLSMLETDFKNLTGNSFNSAQTGLIKDLEGALISLGYKGREKEEKLERAKNFIQEDESINIENLLRKVL